jgi:hypothetical protein
MVVLFLTCGMIGTSSTARAQVAQEAKQDEKTPPPAQSIRLIDENLYTRALNAVFLLFILAVLVESGLALVFRWKPFLSYFDSRSVNALIAFAVSFFLVSSFKLDIVTALVTGSTPEDRLYMPGAVLTAMIIAGGSAGVNRVFRSLGFRPTEIEDGSDEKPQRNHAWIAVTLVRREAKGPVSVLIGQTQDSLAVAGTISGVSQGNRLWRYFLRDKGRFPQSGGYSIEVKSEPSKKYIVQLKGTNGTGHPVLSKEWGPFALAPGAIIDIELTV